MDALAKSKFSVAQAREKFGGEIRILSEHGPKQRVPVFGRIGRRHRSLHGSAHYLFFNPADLVAGLAEASAEAGALPAGS